MREVADRSDRPTRSLHWQSLGEEPGLSLGSRTEDASGAEVWLGHHLKHAHHAEERIPWRDDRTEVEPNLTAQLSDFMADGFELVAIWQRIRCTEVEQDIKARRAIGVLLQCPEMIDYFVEGNVADTLGANDSFLRINLVGHRHIKAPVLADEDLNQKLPLSDLQIVSKVGCDRQQPSVIARFDNASSDSRMKFIAYDLLQGRRGSRAAVLSYLHRH